MKKLIATLSLALLGVAPWMSVQAANYCDPCRDPCCTPCCNCCGSFEVGGEALYWKACTDNAIFAVTVLQAVTPVFFQVDAVHKFQDEYEWGFRLFARYYDCDACNYIGLEWTYFDSRRTVRKFADTANNFFLVPPQFDVAILGSDEAAGRTRVDYNAVDLEGGHRLVFCGCGPSNSPDLCCGFSMYLLAALRYVDACDDQKSRFENIDVAIEDPFYRFDNKNRFRGGGPRLGFRFRYDVWCGFGIVGKFATSVLVGSRRSRLNYGIRDGAGVVIFEDDFTQSSGAVCVPQIDAKLGVDYCFSCCGTFVFEAGWAWEHMWAGMSSLQFNLFSVNNRVYDFGVGGPYIRAAYRF